MDEDGGIKMPTETKIEIVTIIKPDAIDMERAQEKGRELEAAGKRNIRIEVKEVEQPTLAYIYYDEPPTK